MDLNVVKLMLDALTGFANNQADSHAIIELREKLKEARNEYDKAVAAHAAVERPDTVRTDDELAADLGSIGIPSS